MRLPFRRPASARRYRGQAAVEMSLLLIVLVPIIFYTLFLDDLLRHRLDLMESVVSSPWDFAAIDQQDNKGENIDGLERLSWCDHTLTYNSYDNGYECDNNIHHKAFTAHVCWIVEGGQQVTCSTDQGTAKVDDNAEWNGGGMTTCSARAGVFNYFIVNNIFGGAFSNTDMVSSDKTKGVKLTGAAHSHYNEASSNIFMLEMQRFAVLHDTWAMKTPDNIEASFDFFDFGFGDTSSFKGRVKKVYDDNAQFDDADDFFDKLEDEDLIDSGAKNDGMGDAPSTLHMSFDSSPGHEFGLLNKHYSSAYGDSRVSGTHGARQNAYYGVPESDW